MFVNLILPTYTTNQNYIETTKEKQQMKLQLQKPKSAFTSEKKNKPWNKTKSKMEKTKRSWTIIFAYEIGSLLWLITSIPYSPMNKSFFHSKPLSICWTKCSFQLVKITINLSTISHNQLQPNVKVINQTPFVAFA